MSSNGFGVNYFNSDLSNSPKISIGMPIYNAEKFLRNRLEGILSQTFSDFELIISDNASTDSTLQICKEYSNKDKRIILIRQEKNIGSIRNFNFVLQKAKGRYFVWAAADDIWTKDFLEKNVKILDSDSKVVGSIGNVKFYDDGGEYKIDLTKSKLKNFLKYRNTRLPKYQHVHPFSGEYEKKVGYYLRFNQSSIIYSLYRTNNLKESMNKFKPLFGWEDTVIPTLFRFGDIHVIDEVLFYKYAKGMSGPNSSYIDMLRNMQMSMRDIISLQLPLAFWYIKNVGIKFFFKNIDWFIVLNSYLEYLIIRDLIKKCKLKITRLI